jgi:hypothetical protein
MNRFTLTIGTIGAKIGTVFGNLFSNVARGIDTFMLNLKGPAVQGILNNPLAGPVMNAIGAVAGQWKGQKEELADQKMKMQRRQQLFANRQKLNRQQINDALAAGDITPQEAQILGMGGGRPMPRNQGRAPQFRARAGGFGLKPPPGQGQDRQQQVMPAPLLPGGGVGMNRQQGPNAQQNQGMGGLEKEVDKFSSIMASRYGGKVLGKKFDEINEKWIQVASRQKNMRSLRDVEKRWEHELQRASKQPRGQQGDAIKVEGMPDNERLREKLKERANTVLSEPSHRGADSLANNPGKGDWSGQPLPRTWLYNGLFG